LLLTLLCLILPMSILCSPLIYTLWKDCVHLHMLHKYEIFVPEVFLTCVLKILNPLSLNVKLHHSKNLFFCLSTIVIKVWPQLLIKTKSRNYYKFVDMNLMAFQNLLIPTFKNCSKIMIDWIEYLLIKKIKYNFKPSYNLFIYFSFCVLEQRNMKSYFPKTFSLTAQLEY
jgi:hypothetical protein